MQRGYFMKTHRLLAATAAAILALTGSAALAQDRGQRGGQNQQGQTQFNEHDQQAEKGTRVAAPVHRAAHRGPTRSPRTFTTNYKRASCRKRRYSRPWAAAIRQIGRAS